MRIRIGLSLIAILGLLAGCSLPGLLSSSPGRQEEEKDSLGLAPEFSYEAVVQTPNILVNQIGYEPQGSKVALLQGQGLAESFFVYRAVDERLMFEGSLTGRMEETQGGEKRIYAADFSPLEEEGAYYLFHEDLGYSYSFSIREEVYLPLEEHTLTLLGEEAGNTAGLCEQLAALLLALELYPENPSDREGLELLLEEKMERLLLAQDELSGSVYEELADAKEGEASAGRLSLTATAEFAGALAMYACRIEEAEPQKAAQYLLLAEKAYGSIQDSLDKVGYDSGYFAAAWLFKLTGRQLYANAVGQYLALGDGALEGLSCLRYFGDYAYLSAPSGVDLDWSKQIMNRALKEAETISLLVHRDYYYVSRERGLGDMEAMLQEMTVMALVNYIIPNHEYTMIQKNYLEYFLGRNPGALCLAEGFGINNPSEEEAAGLNAGNAALFYLLLQSTK